MRACLRRLIRAAAIVLRDPSIPRPVRGVAAIALLPIPGPVDEAVLLLIAPLLLTAYRRQMRAAWEGATRGVGSGPPKGASLD
ncbi:MAG TPA: hypothetical protein VHT27_13640 [Solirubrobacteraceae bacterium]|jgi:hypothetical protein|nr:hypothetical protein [Solirubrobacteraceae bacterium]